MPMPPTPSSLELLLGHAPDPAPLHPHVVSTDAFDGYVQPRVTYATSGTERVEALLLMPSPRPTGRLPAIVAIHQDGERRPYTVGKSEVAGLAGDPDLAYGRELCLRGYVVICPDRFGFESRCLASSEQVGVFAEFPIESTTLGIDLTEDLYKGAVANRLLFTGWTMLGRELFELSRAIDYLETLATDVEVDRIGAIGHSAGGHLVSYLMYLDARVKAGCASCGSWYFAHAFRDGALRPMQGFGGMMTVPGMAMWGDTDDVLAGLAPRPYWEHRGDFGEDFGSSELTAKAREKYSDLGVPERFAFVDHELGHVFPATLRDQAYRWFDRWLRSS